VSACHVVDPPALVLGYGAVNEQAIRNGLAVLGSMYAQQQESSEPPRHS
jgi:hypothetical protein